MGFSPETKMRTLVAAARHCCVCHRYKGVKVEVHHIIHQNQGGTDEIENAIALCFDCHADAGHYNPKHPRGTRFSPAELRTHRDEWYQIVKRNAISSPEDQDNLYCRYLVCQSFEAFREISYADFGKLPFGNCALVENPVLRFHRKLVQLHPEEYRHSREWGRTYSTRDEYWRIYPKAKAIDGSDDTYPYFEAKRDPTESELEQSVYSSDPVTRLLVQEGVPVADVAQAFLYEEKCGRDKGMFQEVYRLRPLWAAYLAITNLSSEQIRFKSIEAFHEDTAQVSYRAFNRPSEVKTSTLKLPPAPLLPNSTVIVPLATMLGPFEPFDVPEWSQVINELPDYQSQELIHTSFSKNASNTNIIGAAIWPSTVRFHFGGVEYTQEVHKLDLSNLYALNRYWEMGSCPHLFFRDSSTQKLIYSGELFQSIPGKLNKEKIYVPSYANEFVIAELEYEETFIEQISGEEFEARENIHLRKGDVFSTKVEPLTTLYITGYL